MSSKVRRLISVISSIVLTVILISSATTTVSAATTTITLTVIATRTQGPEFSVRTNGTAIWYTVRRASNHSIVEQGCVSAQENTWDFSKWSRAKITPGEYLFEYEGTGAGEASGVRSFRFLVYNDSTPVVTLNERTLNPSGREVSVTTNGSKIYYSIIRKIGGAVIERGEVPAPENTWDFSKWSRSKLTPGTYTLKVDGHINHFLNACPHTISYDFTIV